MFGAGGISPVQLLIVVGLAVIFFGGKGKMSAAMTDLAKGLRGFREGLKDDAADTPAPTPESPVLQISAPEMEAPHLER